MAIPARTSIDSEALGAFAHDVRTPLNAAQMVVEVARRLGGDGQLQLDEELTEMLLTSIKDIERLVSDLQDVSRIERGKQRLAPGPASLAEGLAAARELLAADLAVTGELCAIDGPWDRDRLGRMLADFARSANRCGSGAGEVAVRCDTSAGDATIVLASGVPGSVPRTVGADAGWGYFRARALVLAMGGSVEATRTDGYMAITVTLPR